MKLYKAWIERWRTSGGFGKVFIPEKKSRLIVCFSLILLWGACARQASQPVDQNLGDGLVPITILHTNDTHGHAWPAPGKDGVRRGGFAALAKVIEGIREDVKAHHGITLLLSAGDVNTGVPESDLLLGEPDFMAMDQMGYDAMALGNHDFDGGLDRLRLQRKWATFPILSANVVYAGTHETLVPPYIVVAKGGVKFGILGLMTETLKSVSLPQNVEGVDVLDPIETAKVYIPKMQAGGAEFLIALTHLGVAGTGKRPKAQITKEDTALASQVPALQVIVGGHSHTLLPEGLKIKATRIVQAGEKGEHLGRLDILWDKRKQEMVESKAQVIPINPELGEDANLKALLDLYQAKVGPILDQELGTAVTPLDGERENVRSRETNLGDLLCDILREGTGADVALYNGGGIRASIAKGVIKLRDIYRVLPFRNTVVTATITGKQLKDVLEESLKYQHETGSFLQVSGLEYWAKGKSLKRVTVKGKRVSDSARYRVVSNNFLMAGGDFLQGLAGAEEVKDTQIPVEDYLVKHLKQGGKIDAKVAGRIHLGQPVK